MQVSQRIAKLVGPVEDLPFGQELALAAGIVDQLLEIATRHVIHHQQLAAVLREVVRDFGQAGMVQAGQHAGLAVELLLHLRQVLWQRTRLRQNLLDRAHPARQAQVIGLIDRTHAALADQLDDLITSAQDNTRLKWCRHSAIMTYVRIPVKQPAPPLGSAKSGARLPCSNEV